MFFWELLAITVCLVCCFIAIRDYMAFPAFLLLISNFFVLDISFLPTKSSWLFFFIFFFVLIYRHWRYGLGLLKEKYAWYLVGGYFAVLLLPCLYHWLIWKQWPYVYFVDSFKTLWSFIFLLVPVQTINIKRFSLYMLAALLCSIFLTAPETIAYYFQHDRSMGRDLHVALIDGVVVRNFGLETSNKFVMDENAARNMGIMLASLIWMQFSLLWRKKAMEAYQLFLLLLVTLTIFYFNQYLNSVICLVVIMLSFLIILTRDVIYNWQKLLSLIKKGRYQLALIFSLLFFSIFYLVRNKTWTLLIAPYVDRFNINLDPDGSYGGSRLSLFVRGILSIIENPLKGLGFTSTYVQSQTPSGGELTMHSTFLDNLLSFGVPVGLVANGFYLLPFILFLFYRKFWHFSLEERFLWFATFSIAFYELFGSLFARYSTQRGFWIIMLIFFIKRLHAPKASV